MEISRPTKYLLQRGALINATLSSTSYRRSPLVQGGMEIPCRMSVWMPETFKNRAIVEKYKEMVDVLYTEPDGCAILGSFLHHNMNYPSGETSTSLRKRRTEFNNSSVKNSKNEVAAKDIRRFLKKAEVPVVSVQEHQIPHVIELD